MGIRLKLVSSLAAILIVSTILLATVFAFREQRNLVALKRDHLQHSAELAGNLLSEIAPTERERAIGLWNRTTATGPSYKVLFSGDHEESPNSRSQSDFGSPGMMSTTVRIPATPDGKGWQLMAVEPRPDTRALLIASLGEHFMLGVLLTAAAILAVALICHRLVVRPVHWLIAAADAMAQGDDWEPIRPLTRRRDEIGILGDHFADLSRRLASAVRSARHGSAHLVAVRVRRELEDPIRRLTLGLATLEAAGSDDLDAKREIQDMYDQIRVLRETSARLSEISPDPETGGVGERRAISKPSASVTRTKE